MLERKRPEEGTVPNFSRIIIKYLSECAAHTLVLTQSR